MGNYLTKMVSYVPSGRAKRSYNRKSWSREAFAPATSSTQEVEPRAQGNG